jgi:hypothetical protein
VKGVTFVGREEEGRGFVRGREGNGLIRRWRGKEEEEEEGGGGGGGGGEEEGEEEEEEEDDEVGNEV